MTDLQLNIFGFPQLRKSGQAVVLKTGKTFGLLLYLALEPGWHSRDKLADLLWPDADQEQGRGSLRKSLTLLRQALGDAFPLRVERERICLEPSRIVTDLSYLRAEADDLPAGWSEGVLRDFSLPDSSPFDDWLEGQRKVLQERLDQVIQAQMLRQQAKGRPDAALSLAKSRVALDPFGEEAHLELMRLLWEQGRTSQALEVYREYRRRLWREFQLNPSPEMLRLVRSIQGHRGTLLRPTLKSEQSLNQVPLVGREREWGLMEEAWKKGQAILISGAAGSGKSRLALEFCASKGTTVRTWARQGDEGIPYVTHARNFAYFFFDQPEVTAKLPEWVRGEMARIIPWLGPPAAHPIRNQEDKDRLLTAKVITTTMMAEERGWDMFFVDDLQFTDSATIEMGLELQRRLLPYPPDFFRSVFAFRGDEMPPFFAESLRQWVREDLAVWIELEPLKPEAVAQWLNLRNAGDHLQSVLRLTGGNPLFVHETLQALEDHPQGTALPRSQRAKQVLWHRLERLSPNALSVAQIAALSVTDFSFDMGEWVLKLEPHEAERVSRELQDLGIFKGSAFSHDLLFETTREDIPPGRKTEFSTRIAQYLEATQPYTAPGRLARYYLSSDQPHQAVGYLLEAGRLAVDTFVLDQAADWYELAAKVLQGLGRAKEALEIFARAASLRPVVSSQHVEV